LNNPKTQAVLAAAAKEKRTVLLEPEAKEICRIYGIPVPDFGLAQTSAEATQLAEKIGYPVVVKVVSPDIVHKTEAGGVIVNLNSAKEVQGGFATILDNAKKVPNAKIAGILVQKMAPKGVEVIVGGLRDNQFGPSVMFGLGGVFVEVLKDTAFRVAPIDDLDAVEMIRDVRAYKILKGVRGQAPADERAVAQLIKAVARILLENPSVDQIDLNPVMVYADGATAVDARIVLGGK